jgi:hypothetical protein
MAWRTRSLADVDAICLYFDGFALRVQQRRRCRVCVGARGGRLPPDGRKQLLALCSGESFAGVEGLPARGLRHPVRHALKDSTSHRPAASVLHRRLPNSALSGSGDVRPGSGA